VTPVGTPQLSPKSSPKLDSPNTESLKIRSHRKTRSRQSSVNGNSPKYTIPIESLTLSNQPKVLINTQQNVMFNGDDILINYELSDINYLIFIIEKKDNDIICRGITDGEIKLGDVPNNKTIQINYKFNECDIIIVVYASDLDKFTCPIYFNIITTDIELKINQFMENLENILKLVHMENTTKDQ
jgi:hypothetical protein